MFNEKVKFFGPPGHQGERPGKTGRDSEKSGGELKKKQNKKHQLDMKLETVTTGGKAQGRGRRIIVGLQNYVFAYRLDGEGNGTSLQYSCLENPMDGGAW